MDQDEQRSVRSHALRRIGNVFRRDVGTLDGSMRFGVDLNCSFVSYWRRNEFDLIHDDIRDVADKKVLREIESERLVIWTVGDYCDHMAACYATRPAEVRSVLEM